MSTAAPRQQDIADATDNLRARARAFHDAGQLGKAELLYRRSLVLRPDNVGAGRDLGCLLAQTGRAEESTAWLELAVARDPLDFFAQFNLGLSRAALQRWKSALKAFDAATHANPGFADTWFHRAQTLRKLDRDRDALSSLDAFLQIAPRTAEAWLNKGNILSDRGDHLGAIAAYDRAVACNPSLASPWFNRANILGRVQRFEESLASYEGALQRDPQFYAAAVNRANLLTAMKRWEDADKAYESAILISPDAPDAWTNRGASWANAGCPERAMPFLKKALELEPGQNDAACNLGSTLRKLGKFSEALEAFSNVLRIAPHDARALNGRAQALRDLNRLQESLKTFDAAQAADPLSVEVAINRASLLNSCGQSRAALLGIDRILSHAPGAADVWTARANTQLLMNDNGGAIASYNEALRIAPDFAPARFGETMAHLRILYRDERDIARSRAAYGQALERLTKWTETVEPTDDVLHAAGLNQPFYLAYQNQDDCALQRRYGGMIRDLVKRRFPDATPPALVKGEKLRIGFVSAFFRRHSNWKIPIRGWLEGLDRDKFSLFGYHIGRDSDEETQYAEKLCDRFVSGYRQPESWRREILSDQPHALIYPGLMMDETSLILAAQRLAPVQCNSWGHPETSGLPTLDYFLGSEWMDAPGAEDFYTEELVRLPGLSISYTNPTIDILEQSRQTLGLKPDAFVFWSGQTAIKYLPQFDDIFPRIATLAPKAQFLFLNFPRAPEITAFFRRRLSRAFARRGLEADEHCVFVGPFSHPEFVGAMKSCDAMLDNIGWSACNSMLESFEAELPVVTYPGRFLRSRHGAAILRAIGNEEGVVDSLDDYVEAAVRLVEDNSHRTRQKDAIKLGKSLINSDRAAVGALAKFLDDTIRAAYAKDKTHMEFGDGRK